MKRPDYIVDSHVHFWNPARIRYPWLETVPSLNRAFRPADYMAATASADVGKMIFVEAGCEPRLRRREVEWVSDLAAEEPRLKGIVAQVPIERGAAVRGELAKLARSPLVKGVRRNLQAEPDAGAWLTPKFVRGVRALAEFGFCFDLCITHGQLPAVTQLVRRCPDVFFVLDHCGKPAVARRRLDPWRRHLRDLAAAPNVACKISGLATEAAPGPLRARSLAPYVVHALDCFGPERVMFGGDWPVCTLAVPIGGWLGVLREILADRRSSDLKKIFRTNAEKIYRV